MTAKKFNLKDFLINNGIIVVLVLLAIYTGHHAADIRIRLQLKKYCT